MGCGALKSKENLENSIVNPIDKSNSASQSNVLLRYQTIENVYKIKLVPPKSGK